MRNIFPEKDPNIVTIQKVTLYFSDCLRIIQCIFQTEQDVQCRAIKKLELELKRLNVSVTDFIISCFLLIFQLEKSRIPLQSLDHILNWGEKSSSSSLQTAGTIFTPISTLVWLILLRFFFLPRAFHGPASCALSVLKTSEKKEVPKYSLSGNPYIISEMGNEERIGSIDSPSVKKLDK